MELLVFEVTEQGGIDKAEAARDVAVDLEPAHRHGRASGPAVVFNTGGLYKTFQSGPPAAVNTSRLRWTTERLAHQIDQVPK